MPTATPSPGPNIPKPLWPLYWLLWPLIPPWLEKQEPSLRPPPIDKREGVQQEVSNFIWPRWLGTYCYGTLLLRLHICLFCYRQKWDSHLYFEVGYCSSWSNRSSWCSRWNRIEQKGYNWWSWWCLEKTFLLKLCQFSKGSGKGALAFGSSVEKVTSHQTWFAGGFYLAKVDLDPHRYSADEHSAVEQDCLSVWLPVVAQIVTPGSPIDPSMADHLLRCSDQAELLVPYKLY